MPYYRILIWLRNEEPKKEGIRFIENSNIDAVQNLMRVKARETYGSKVKDVEVQMLSKGCTAVLTYKEREKKKRERKKLWGDPKPSNPEDFKPVNRREEYSKQEKIPLGERYKNNKPGIPSHPDSSITNIEMNS